jgi:hypothetical protein
MLQGGAIPGSGLVPWVAKPLGAVPLQARGGLTRDGGSPEVYKPCEGKAMDFECPWGNPCERKPEGHSPWSSKRSGTEKQGASMR